MNTIPFTSVQFCERARTTYRHIDLLANSIRDHGLQCPIILSPLPDGQYLLEDGGRRYRALESLGVVELFHGATGDPSRPGYVLKSEVSSRSAALLTELVANLHREQLDWRDEVKLIVPAWYEFKRSADLAGDKVFYRTFGAMLGNYNHADINAAVQIYEELVAKPEKFANCTSLHNAYGVLLTESRKALEKEMVARTMLAKPQTTLGDNQVTQAERPTTQNDSVTSSASQITVIPLSHSFKLGNSLDYLESADCPVFDHIICDPDFAVSKERLGANSDNAIGVAQDSVEDSLADLHRFITSAFHKSRGFCVFWYDLDHHEKLQCIARSAGWLVQRWPITWLKLGHGSNAAPSHNLTKNEEWAMVLRHPSATLATPGALSAFALPNIVNPLNPHPFAKPFNVWEKLYSAVATPGQTVFDPFMGSGSGCIAALRSGLVPSGMELQEEHFNTAILNLQAEYKKIHGDAVTFQ